MGGVQNKMDLTLLFSNANQLHLWTDVHDYYLKYSLGCGSLHIEPCDS